MSAWANPVVWPGRETGNCSAAVTACFREAWRRMRESARKYQTAERIADALFHLTVENLNREIVNAARVRAVRDSN